jgi:hypothetical protein
MRKVGVVRIAINGVTECPQERHSLSKGQQNSYVTRRNNSREMAKGRLRDSQERIPPKAPWGLASR